MKRFVFRVLILGVIFCGALPLPAIVRILLWQGKVNASMSLRPDQDILFIGDSHIGATFVEHPKYRNRVLWESSMPQQFTLMRLRDFERRGALKNVKILVLEFGLQNFGQQRRLRMRELWWRMLPISWRHADVCPLSFLDKALQFLTDPSGRVEVCEKMLTANVPVMERTEEARIAEFASTSEIHFDWIKTPDEMCFGWEVSLKNALLEINQICVRNDVQLIVLTAPLTPYYVKAIPAAVQEKFDEYVRYISDLGVPYFDCRTCGRIDDFRDSFHFRLDGAKRFTEWFYQEIIGKYFDASAT